MLDDGTLAVFADINEARGDIEFPKVENDDAIFYNERGELLEATFPYRSDRRFLGLRITDDPGPFELAPSPSSDPSAINVALSRAVALKRNKWFASLDDVRAHFGTGSTQGIHD